MSLHSYSRVWLHLVWATLERKPLLSKAGAAKLSEFLSGYASEKGIHMKINYVNPDHVHALIDLPTSKSIEDVMHLFKGSSSHWVNERNLAAGKIQLGSRARSILSRAIRRRRSGTVHCGTGTASSKENFR